MVQGKAGLGQSNYDRPNCSAEIDPRRDRRFREGVPEGPGAARWERVFLARESPKEGVLHKLAGRRASDLARRGKSALVGGVAGDRRASRPAGVPLVGAIPEPVERRIYAIHDTVEPIPTRRRAAGSYYEHPK